MPLYNEIQNVRAAVTGALDQDYPQLKELWFVDGGSTDDTFAELQRFSPTDARVRVCLNPRRRPAAAINQVVALTQCDMVVRFDAHARYARDVVREGVKVLLETGAAGVGPPQRPVPSRTRVSLAIVAAHESRLGVGVARHRRPDTEGWTDTIWSGCYWRHVMQKVGPFREDLARTEDNDFNARVRALGYGLFLSPRLQACYYPRETLRALASQHFANGVGVMQTLFQNPAALGWRHLAPGGFVGGMLLLAAQALAWPRLGLWILPAWGLYLAAVTVASLTALARRPGLHVLWLPLVFLTLHFSYGFGSLAKLCSLPFEALKRWGTREAQGAPGRVTA